MAEAPPLDWKEFSDGEMEFDVLRPSDGTAIVASIVPHADGWTWSMGWDLGDDPDTACDCFISGEAETIFAADAACRAGVQAALVQETDQDEVLAAARAAIAEYMASRSTH